MKKLFKDFIKLHRGYDLPKSKRVQGNYPIISSTRIDGNNKDYKVNRIAGGLQGGDCAGPIRHYAA